LQTGSLLAPLLRFYQILLYPVAKPTVMDRDSGLGREGVQYFRERDVRKLIQRHIDASDS
jgi:CBS domain containing-hemolysin-like protein